MNVSREDTKQVKRANYKEAFILFWRWLPSSSTSAEGTVRPREQRKAGIRRGSQYWREAAAAASDSDRRKGELRPCSEAQAFSGHKGRKGGKGTGRHAGIQAGRHPVPFRSQYRWSQALFGLV